MLDRSALLVADYANGLFTVDLVNGRITALPPPKNATLLGIDGIVLLPFAWRNVDAYHLLPQFDALRSHIDGSSDPSRAEHVAETLIAAVDHALAEGALATLVLHTWLIEAERDAVRSVLGHIRANAWRGELWAARCDEVARWIGQHPGAFTGAAKLDTTSWLEPASA